MTCPKPLTRLWGWGGGAWPGPPWNSVSEKWFHDLNSHNKFSRHRQNKTFKCVRKLYSFSEWRNNSCNTYQCLALLAQFLHLWQDIMLNCASACADAIQARPHRLKTVFLCSQKFHRTKVPSSEKWVKWPLF